MYIVFKYKINFHSLRNGSETLTKGSLFYQHVFLKLVQMNIFVRKL